jgi:antitoxin YefM
LPIETTYTSLRQNLASVLNRVIEDRETVIVRRRGAADVALVPAAELAGLVETAHLLRSGKNAQRLLRALRRAERGEGKAGTLDGLRRETGLGPSRQR